MPHLTILAARGDIKEPVSGSSIRVAGYTKCFDDLGVSYTFVSPVKPAYVAAADYFPFSVRGVLAFCIRIHNILFQTRLLRLFSYLLRLGILRSAEVNRLIIAAKGTLLVSHQNGSIPLFLKLTRQQRFIYDVHGILSLQKEYLEDSSLKGRLLFWICLLEEKGVYRWADVVNATSEPMVRYLQSAFETHAQFVVAPDGLLREDLDAELDRDRIDAVKRELGFLESDRVLFFAGSFKKFGGVHVLVDAFCELAQEFRDIKLLLIGQGQMEQYVTKRIRSCGLEDRCVRKKQVLHSMLPYYQHFATLIICPDITESLYNQITPHIKVFDSIASGKPVVVTESEALRAVIPSDWRVVKYTSTEDLKNAIADALADLAWFRRPSRSILQRLTYANHARGVVGEYRRLGLLP